MCFKIDKMFVCTRIFLLLTSVLQRNPVSNYFLFKREEFISGGRKLFSCTIALNEYSVICDKNPFWTGWTCLHVFPTCLVGFRLLFVAV